MLTGLADTSPHYVWDKADTLAAVAARVAELAGQASDARERGTGRVRMPAVARAVEVWSQKYTAGRLLFPRRAGGAR